jgi:alpha-1,3-glucosyltransferase
MMASQQGSRSLCFSDVVALFSVAALLRALVGYQPHSGQDNYHGLHAAYGGDYEAQRHWMELTWHLPVAEWYWYDLQYWGLDYPPLSAYVSYLFGGLSHLLVGPQSVALVESRGFEDPVHKAFMRATVVCTDLAVYGTAAWFLTRPANGKHDVDSAWLFLLAVAQPAILLIDHGHFQYNTTALGLTLWAAYCMTRISRPSVTDCVKGSILFCLALSFKQMCLYYAPAIFFYLLGWCFADNKRQILPRFAALAVTVIVTFAALWWPLVVYGPDGTTATERALHVLRRILPLQRGLFEGKVSNLWCVLSVKPFRIRRRMPEHLQPVAALALTLALAAPSCYRLFLVGSQPKQLTAASNAMHYHRRMLLWGATSSALAFFLASFQVHEKSLLLALAAATMLWNDDPTFCQWFSIVTTWTMWELMRLDRLQTAYVCTLVLFVCFLCLRDLLAAPRHTRGFFQQHALLEWIPTTTYVLMVMLHVAEIHITVPPHLPDLFPVLWSIGGCGCCCLAWLITCWHLFRTPAEDSAKQKVS